MLYIAHTFEMGIKATPISCFEQALSAGKPFLSEIMHSKSKPNIGIIYRCKETNKTLVDDNPLDTLHTLLKKKPDVLSYDFVTNFFDGDLYEFSRFVERAIEPDTKKTKDPELRSFLRDVVIQVQTNRLIAKYTPEDLHHIVQDYNKTVEQMRLAHLAKMHVPKTRICTFNELLSTPNAIGQGIADAINKKLERYAHLEAKVLTNYPKP